MDKKEQEKIKCATFDKEMQDAIPKEIREKMNVDRKIAEQEQAFQEWYDKVKTGLDCFLDAKDGMKIAWQSRQSEIDDLQAKLDEAKELLRHVELVVPERDITITFGSPFKAKLQKFNQLEPKKNESINK